jgi:hypothetical protein
LGIAGGAVGTLQRPTSALSGCASSVLHARRPDFLTGSDTVKYLFGWLWPAALLGLVIWMIIHVRRQLHSRTGRWLLYPVFAALIIASVGGGYETVAESIDAACPIAGQLIDVGGHKLYLNCTGSGSPTVVLEPGLGETSAVMGWIAQAVAADTKVCVYDRAGRGRSEATDGPMDGAQTAADLHTLLDRAHVPGPYVLAGHSFGGLYILTLADNYPDRVAGMVLLDSTAPAASAAPTKTGSWSLSSPTTHCRHGLGTRRTPGAEPPAMSKASSTSPARGRRRYTRPHFLWTLPTSRSS